MKKTGIILLAFLICLTSINITRAAASTDTDKVAVALVIDNSGSMADTDPGLNRVSASAMVLELLGEGDYISVSTFSNDAVNIIPMTKLDQASNATVKNTLKNTLTPKGFTDYTKALELAKSNLDSITEENLSKFIIFLTDGEPMPEGTNVDMNAYKGDLLKKATELGNSGYPVYTVGFGEYDKDILNKISETTRGASVKGDSSSLALSFFDVLKQLKNRDQILSDTNNGEDKSYEINLDGSTERITILVSDPTANGTSILSNKDGKAVNPVMDTKALKVFHLFKGSEAQNQVYTLKGKWTGTINAVRDTKTKLWITEPENNAQIPFESTFSAKANYNGEITGNSKLVAVIKKNGSDINLPLEVVKNGSEYLIKGPKFPQTGEYELEVSLLDGEAILARTQSFFKVKNIPVISSDILLGVNPVIEGTKETITASLKSNGKIVTEGLKNVTMSMDILKDYEMKNLTLLDDGETASGDILANDGIYSVIVEDFKKGPTEITFNARGDYGSEAFFQSSKEQIEVLPKGTVYIDLPKNFNIANEDTISFKVAANNVSQYPEQLLLKVNDEIIQGSKIDLAPSEKTEKTISVYTGTIKDEVKISFVPTHSVTDLVQNSDKIAKPAAEIEKKDNSTLIFGGVGALVLALIGILFLRKRPRKSKPAELKGTLQYKDKGSDEPVTMTLKGTEVATFSIGPEKIAEQHIFSEIPIGFRFFIVPMFSDKGTSVELKCSAPGMFKKDEEIMTSAILTGDEEFTMGGKEFVYHSGNTAVDGKDMLSGKL